MGKDCKGVHMDAIGVSVRFLKGFLKGCHKDFYKDSKGIQSYSTGFLHGFKGISKGILWRFNGILKDF